MRLLLIGEQGREIDVYLYGDEPDDLQIEDAFYTDNHEEEVLDSVVEYLMRTHCVAIYEVWSEYQSCRAEAYQDALMDR
jgi:hypothetical protein